MANYSFRQCTVKWENGLELPHTVILWKQKHAFFLAYVVKLIHVIVLFVLQHSYYLYAYILIVCELIHTLSSLFIHTMWKSLTNLTYNYLPNLFYSFSLILLKFNKFAFLPIWTTHGVLVLAWYSSLTSFVTLEIT